MTKNVRILKVMQRWTKSIMSQVLTVTICLPGKIQVYGILKPFKNVRFVFEYCFCFPKNEFLKWITEFKIAHLTYVCIDKPIT